MFFVGIGVHLQPPPPPTPPKNTWFWKGRKSMYLPCDEKDNQSISIHNHLGRHKVGAFITPVKLCLKWFGWMANLVNGAVNHAHSVGEVWKCVQELAPPPYRVPFYIILIIHQNRHNMVNLFRHGAFTNTENMCQNMQS